MAAFSAAVVMSYGMTTGPDGYNTFHYEGVAITYGFECVAAGARFVDHRAAVVMTYDFEAAPDGYNPNAGSPPEGLTVREAGNEVLRMWGMCCDTEPNECLKEEVLGVVNGALQFIHANGRELPYLAGQTRYYFLNGEDEDQPQRLFKLDSDILGVTGYVRLAHPWASFYFRLNDESNPVPLGFTPFDNGNDIILSFDGDAYRVTFTQDGTGDAAALQSAIQATICNEARCWVTYKPKQYLKITFDVQPEFIVTKAHVLPAAAEVTEIDFTGFTANGPGGLGTINDLAGRGVILDGPAGGNGGGDVNVFWFNIDDNDPPPYGDFTFQVDISGSDTPTEWAQALATAINANIPLEYSASAGGGVVTATAQFEDDGRFVFDGTPPTGLVFTVITAGSSGVGYDQRQARSMGPDGALIQTTALFGITAGLIPYTDGDTPTPLIPLTNRAQADHYENLYGSDAPQAYYLERQHVSRRDSTQTYIYFAPPITEDVIVAVDVQVEPQRVNWSDYEGSTVIPIPHNYIESLLLPILRHRATSSRRYRQRERHEAVQEQYRDAVAMLGLVDPQTPSVKEGKEAAP